MKKQLLLLLLLLPAAGILAEEPLVRPIPEALTQNVIVTENSEQEAAVPTEDEFAVVDTYYNAEDSLYLEESLLFIDLFTELVKEEKAEAGIPRAFTNSTPYSKAFGEKDYYAMNDTHYWVDRYGSDVFQAAGSRGFSEDRDISYYTDDVPWVYLFDVPMEIIDHYETTRGADSSRFGFAGFGGTTHFYRKKNFKPFIKIEAGGLGHGLQAAGSAYEYGPFYGTAYFQHFSNTGYRQYAGVEMTNIDLIQGVHLNAKKTKTIEVGYQRTNDRFNLADALEADAAHANPQRSSDRDLQKGFAEVAVLRYYDQLQPDLHLKADYSVFWTQQAATNTSDYPSFVKNWPGLGANDARAISNLFGMNAAAAADWKKDFLFKNETWTIGAENTRELNDIRLYTLNEDWQKSNQKTIDKALNIEEKGYFAGYTGTYQKEFILDCGVRHDQVEMNELDFKRHKKLDGYYYTKRAHRAGVYWKKWQQGGFFANYREAHKPAPLSVPLANGFDDDLGPSAAKTTETGLRWDYLPIFQGEILAYKTKVSEETALVKTGKYDNDQASLREGVELSLGQALSRTAKMKLVYTTCKARYTDSVGHSFDGKAVPLAPQDTLGVSLLWEVKPKTITYIQYRKIGPQYISADNTNDYDPIRPYQIIDLRAVNQKEWGEIYLDIQNLFNERNRIYGETEIDADNFPFNIYEEERYNFLVPRFVKAGVKYLF